MCNRRRDRANGSHYGEMLARSVDCLERCEVDKWRFWFEITIFSVARRPVKSEDSVRRFGTGWDLFGAVRTGLDWIQASGSQIRTWWKPVVHRDIFS